MLVIDRNWNSGTAEVSVGDTFRVELAENPTTGFRWHLQSAVGPALRILKDSFETSADGYGSGGIRCWVFAADNPAVVAVRIELKRSWQPQSVESFDITINIKPR